MGSSRLTTVRNLILKAKQAYYFGGQPIMTDREYDALEDELAKLNPKDPILATVGAPVPADSILTKATHKIPMGSQGKVNTADEFHTWYGKTPGGKIHASLKGDGASAAGYYHKGRLEQVISRGDGREGEDISANAVRFQGLPAYIEHRKTGPFSGAVRFEVILTIDDWAKVDPKRSKNPRNLGNGIMGRKNGKDAHLLSIFAFDVDDKAMGFDTESDKTKRIKELGFQVIPHRLCTTADQCVAYYRKIDKDRDSLPFWIDGVVMKVDDLTEQKNLGVTGGRPKGQTAWKFESEGAETKVRSYSISGGHTGVLVPNAQLDPVDIGGTTVANALLNNWEEIERLGVAVGDTVWVIKANDIIPKVIEVRKRAPKGKRKSIPEPKKCPFCGGKVGRRKNTSGDAGVATMCFNEDCPKKSTGKIKRWIKSLDIQGIGDSVRDALVEQLDLEDPADLYVLRKDPDALAALIINADKDIRLGTKRATTILDEIEQTRKLTLTQFMGSLGVEGLGKRRVELMMKAADGKLDRLSDWRKGKLRKPDFAATAGVPNLGDKMQDRIDALSPVIDRLLKNGVKVSAATTKASKAASSAKSKGTVCITGKLPSGKKKGDYKVPLAKAGYALVDAVSSGLDFLVVSDPNSNSSKAQKARRYNVKLISEKQLERMVR